MEQGDDEADDEEEDEWISHPPPSSNVNVNLCSFEYGLDITKGWPHFYSGTPADNSVRIALWASWMDDNFGKRDKLTSDPKDNVQIDNARKAVIDAGRFFQASRGTTATYETEWRRKIEEHIHTLYVWWQVKNHGLELSTARKLIRMHNPDPFPQGLVTKQQASMLEIRTQQAMFRGDPSMYAKDRVKDLVPKDKAKEGNKPTPPESPEGKGTPSSGGKKGKRGKKKSEGDF